VRLLLCCGAPNESSQGEGAREGSAICPRDTFIHLQTNPAGELLTKKILARRSDGTTATIHSAGPVEKGENSRRIQSMDGRYAGIVDRISILHGSANAAELAGL
jgi:hypothetical protein